MKILLIDDDIYLTDTISYFLKKYGFKVDVVNKCSSLDFDKITNSYNVIVLDLMMRRPVGVDIPRNQETGEWIYKNIKERSSDQKIVIATGVDSPGMASKFHRDGTALLKKPLDPKFEDLIQAIKNA